MRESRSGKARGVPAIASDLRLFRMFQHCDPAQLTRLAGFAAEETLQHDTIVYREGDRDADFFVVLAGGIQASVSTPAGTQSLGQVRLGQVFGEVSFLDGGARGVTTRATQPTAVLRFDAPALQRALADDPELAVGLNRAFWYGLAGKIRQANQARLGRGGGAPAKPAGENGAAGTSVDLNPRAKLDLFRERGMSAAELRLLATTLHAQQFEAGACLFLEGAQADAMYIVVDGEVRISRRRGGGEAEPIASLGRGEVLGELALVDDQSRSADGHAGAEGCTVLVVTHQDLDDVLHLNPLAASEFLHLVCGILCHRLRAAIAALGGHAAPALGGPARRENGPARGDAVR